MGFRSLGLGFESEKKSQNGNGIGALLTYQWDQDTSFWDLEKYGGWEMGLVTPLYDRLHRLDGNLMPSPHYAEKSDFTLKTL